MLAQQSSRAFGMVQQQQPSFVASRPASRFVRASAFSRRCTDPQVANSSRTVTASAQPGHVAVPNTQSLPALACHGLTKRQVLEKGTSSIDAALADTLQGLKTHKYSKKATRVLVLLAQAYGDNLKAALSDRLQVLPTLAHKPDVLGKAERLAFEVLDTLNSVNWRAGLNWVVLGPVVGAPLLQSLMAQGHVNTLGLPVYRDQPSEPFTLGLSEFNSFSMSTSFVGSFEELYWDDAMVAHPDPYPLIAKKQLAQQILTPALLETVLARCEAGRCLLGVARSLGLSSGAVVGCGGEEDAVSGSSWFDLGLTHPQAVLGVLLLSQPNLPLAVYLRSAFETALGVSRGLVASFAAAAPVRMQLPAKVQEGFILFDGRGGRDWPRHGSLTAVGAGDADGLRVQPLLLPALQAREREWVAAALPAQGESLAAAGHRRGVFGRMRRAVGSVWRAARRA